MNISATLKRQLSSRPEAEVAVTCDWKLVESQLSAWLVSIPEDMRTLRQLDTLGDPPKLEGAKRAVEAMFERAFSVKAASLASIGFEHSGASLSPGARLLPYRPGSNRVALLVRLHPHAEATFLFTTSPEDALLRSYHTMLDSVSKVRSLVESLEAKVLVQASEDVERIKRRRSKVKEFACLAANHGVKKIPPPELALLSVRAIREAAKVETREVPLTTLRSLLSDVRPKELSDPAVVEAAIDEAVRRAWLSRPIPESVIIAPLGFHRMKELIGK